jgi:hypothetical protein
MYYDGFQSLLFSLGDGGKTLWQNIQAGEGCFLISEPNLLIALRKTYRLHPSTSIQVFSLASPEGQLLGTVTESNLGDPASYCLAAEFPAA